MFLLKVVLLSLVVNQLTAYKMVCYMTNWAQYRPEGGKFFPENVDPNLCTHLMYSFAKMTNGQLDTYEWNDEALYERTMNLKRVNPQLKVLIAVGGWNMGSVEFSNMANNDAARANFVRTSVAFLKKYKFDGLDLDWEYPGFGTGSRPTDKAQFTKLCRELKQAFIPEGLLLTAAVAAGKTNIDNAYEIAAMGQYLDFVNIMTYDYHGGWDPVTGANAPLYSRVGQADPTFTVDFTINYYISQGLPREKVILGMGTYGRSFTLVNARENRVGSPAAGGGTAGTFTRESGFLAYYEICERLSQGWQREYHSEHRVPFAHSGLQWVSYDDTQSLTEKVNFLKTQNLGGAMFWALDLDDFTGTRCGQGRYPLINFVKNALGSTGTVTNPPTQAWTTTTAAQTSSGQQVTTVSSSGGNKCPNGDGYYPDRESGCRRFYQCVGSLIYYFDCPAGLLFSANLGVCTFSNQVQC